jgi:hypothetical protein
MLRLSLLIVFFVLNYSITISQTRLKEDFSSASGVNPPAGWSSQVVSGNASTDKWNFDDPYVMSPLASNSSGTFATFAGFFYSDDGIAESAELISPSFSCASDVDVTLSFYEYYYNDGGVGSGDIFISTDNGTTWAKIYSQSGSESPKVPTLRSLNISSGAAGKSNIRIKFKAAGNGSVAWILDDVSVIAGPTTPPTVIHAPPGNSCQNGPFEISASIQSANDIESAKIIYKVNAGQQAQIVMNTTGNNLYKGVIPSVTGPSNLEYHIVATDASINHNQVYDTGNPLKFHSVRVGNITSSAFLEDFEDTEGTLYEIDKGDDEGFDWTLSPWGKASESSIHLDFYSQEQFGLRATYKTVPIMIDNQKSILIYDRAYSTYNGYSDTLAIYISTDGTSWNRAKRNSGDQFATVRDQGAFFIPEADEWETGYVDVSTYTGSCVTIAFTGVSGNGNNLYIDNMKFTTFPEVKLSLSQNYPNPVEGGFTNVDISLPELKAGLFVIYDLLGRRVYEKALDGSFDNFTLEIDATPFANGIYLYRVIASGSSITKRMVIENR